MKDSPPTMRLAGVDIGTLTCRLLIADLPPSGRLIEVRSERRILRLGEGVDQTKRLSVAAMDRVLQCLREWRELIDAAHVDAIAVVATSAVRDAGNRNEFLDRVKREAGFEVELISGEEEARRTMLGIRSGLPLGVTDVLALDIGGGSTEFILDRPGQNPVVRSIDIGVVRLCERLLHHDPLTDEEIHQAREWVAKETKTAVAGMGNYQTATFVGTAGTVTSLAAMAQKLPTYEPARIHNYRLRLDVDSRTRTNATEPQENRPSRPSRLGEGARRSHSRRRHHHPDGHGDAGDVEGACQRSRVCGKEC